MKNKLILASLALVAVSCTENSRARNYGGTAQVDLPANTKLIGATWKNDELWYLYRPAREGEKPEMLTLQESSSFGIIEGKVIFKEN